MDAIKFGCFVAERRKELKMTQKDLAAKIQVTDKAVSRWERGLGFPDINTIEYLAKALDLSIIELMRSEKNIETEKEQIQEETVSGVLDIAEREVKKKQDIFLKLLVLISFLCSMVEILLSINWNAKQLTMTANIPFTAIVPAVVLIIFSAICKLKGEKYENYLIIGICMLLIPIILVMGMFLI